MNNKTSTSKRRPSCPLICQICGGRARGLNFSVISCMSCKMFFRRHVEVQLTKQQCCFGGKCNITERTRKLCVPCRLGKCLEAGMDVRLIRRSTLKDATIELPKPQYIKLLQIDRSILTSDEWTLLSNVTKTYDEQNLSLQAFAKTYNSLPLKIRGKNSNVLSYIESLFSRICAFIQRCPMFHSLSPRVREVLMKRNIGALSCFIGLFMAKEMNKFENEMYMDLIDKRYGNDYTKRLIQAIQRLDQNGTLIKLMLMIMIFSNNSTVVSLDLSDKTQIMFDPKLSLYLQNMFVDVLWKYLIYQYDFKEAVLRLMSLVKSMLDMIQRMSDGLYTEKHWTVLEKVIEEKKHSMNFENTLLCD